MTNINDYLRIGECESLTEMIERFIETGKYITDCIQYSIDIPIEIPPTTEKTPTINFNMIPIELDHNCTNIADVMMDVTVVDTYDILELNIGLNLSKCRVSIGNRRGMPQVLIVSTKTLQLIPDLDILEDLFVFTDDSIETGRLYIGYEPNKVIDKTGLKYDSSIFVISNDGDDIFYYNKDRLNLNWSSIMITGVDYA